MRSDVASDQFQSVREQLDGVRSSVTQAIERLDALANPPRRGALGIAVPFTRRSRAAELTSALRELPAGLGSPRLPSVSAPRLPAVAAPRLATVRLPQRTRDWSAAFAAAALVF